MKTRLLFYFLNEISFKYRGSYLVFVSRRLIKLNLVCTDEIKLEDEKSSNLVSFLKYLKYFDVEQNLVNRLDEVLKTIGRNFFF